MCICVWCACMFACVLPGVHACGSPRSTLGISLSALPLDSLRQVFWITPRACSGDSLSPPSEAGPTGKPPCPPRMSEGSTVPNAGPVAHTAGPPSAQLAPQPHTLWVSIDSGVSAVCKSRPQSILFVGLTHLLTYTCAPVYSRG